MRKQSEQDQRKRMLKGRCPIHGAPLSQEQGPVGKCSRKNCNTLVLLGKENDGMNKIPTQVITLNQYYRILRSTEELIPQMIKVERGWDSDVILKILEEE
jgi:hypothetical protein